MPTSKKAAGKRYQIQLKVDAFLTIELSAPSLENALAAGRGYKVSDVLDSEIVSDFIDGSAEVTGVYEA